MSQDKKIIIANWKMNPQTAEEAQRFFKALAGKSLPENVEVVIAPPFIYLDLARKNLPENINLAAQNLSWAERGAYTGEISGLMLKNLDCNYVIIGHSERRYKIGETDEMMNLKLKMAIRVGLTPILAVGERVESDDIAKVLNTQLKTALNGLDASEASRIIVAYEPVWAIGTGKPDTPDQALSATLLIRKIIGNLYTPDWAADLLVLYGGSVTAVNAADFIAQAGINGALVGGASLEIDEFLKIIKAAETDA